MWCVRRGPAVGLPNVHLCTACAVMAHRRHVRGVPIQEVRLALHELDVVRALRVAIAGAVLGSGGVPLAIQIAVLVHLDEVHGAVQAAGQVADVNVHGEFTVLQLEHVVGVVAVHDVQPGAVVVSVGALCHEIEGHAIVLAVRGHAIGSGIVSALQRTGLRTSRRVRTEGRVPSVLIRVAVLPALVDPAPIRVEHDRSGLRYASGRCTLLYQQLGVHLRLQCARLLGDDLWHQKHEQHAQHER
mmetsp:Transcript_43316/g.109766  ORF Transcript_43316/g.109766 Transcript_43316/m.109766 type:complete len:243 (-) Transcript_43316:137-865(-)